MNRKLLLSIRPKHLVNILNGKKTLELRKSVPKDFVGWVYLYCTKDRKYWKGFVNSGNLEYAPKHAEMYGKVVARFWFDEYDKYYFNPYQGDYRLVPKSRELLTNATMPLSDLCLTLNEVERYGKEKELFAWYIKKLEIFDRPKELSDFGLTKAPQSYQYVYVKE